MPKMKRKVPTLVDVESIGQGDGRTVDREDARIVDRDDLKVVDRDDVRIVDRDDLKVVSEETAVAGKRRQRRLGLTETWMKNKTIEPALHAAALHFEADFAQGGLRGSYGGTLAERVDTSPDHRDHVLVRVWEAKRRVAQAMGAMGQLAGDVVWHVIGEEQSLREYSSRIRARGLPVNQHELKGRLIVGLDILADHYGCR